MRNGKDIVDIADLANKKAQHQAAYAEAFRQLRIKQNAEDRLEALRSLDIAQWQVFCIRWNLPPPYPRGWGDEDSQLAVMHKIRLMLPDFTEAERIFSAAFLVGHGLALPDGLTFENGKLKGTVNGPGPIVAG